MNANIDVAIIGGGIAGLAVLDRLREIAPDLDCMLFEASDRVGGKLLTETVETDAGRFIVEAGPDGWLTRKPSATALATDLGLADHVLPITDFPSAVSILRNGKPIPIPAGTSLIASPNPESFGDAGILSEEGVTRMFADLDLPCQEGHDDESLGSFVRRRLGEEAVTALAEPLAAGIHNADPDCLSLLATFPLLRQLERDHGSVIRGLRAAQRAPDSSFDASQLPQPQPHSTRNLPSPACGRGAGGEGGAGNTNLVELTHPRSMPPAISTTSPSGMDIGPGGEVVGTGDTPEFRTSFNPTFLTLQNGMGSLISPIERRNQPALQTGAQVVNFQRDSFDRFRISFADGSHVIAASVVLAVPAGTAAELIGHVSPIAARMLSTFRTASAGSISLAYRQDEVATSLPGYGLVVPKTEARAINAITISSRKWPNRAPGGWDLIRVFFGGYRSPQTMDLDDDELETCVRAELRDLLGINAAPAFSRIYRWSVGSPQYDVGHLDRIAQIESELPPEIALVGSAYRGSGIPDLINDGRSVADRIAHVFRKSQHHMKEVQPT